VVAVLPCRPRPSAVGVLRSGVSNFGVWALGSAPRCSALLAWAVWLLGFRFRVSGFQIFFCG
jgi:hypothetical protein